MASILLISRPRGSVDLARSALEIAGHEVLVAAHPSAAARRRFDVALLDAGLPRFLDELRGVARKVVLFFPGGDVTTEQALRSISANGLIRDLAPGTLLRELSRHLAA